jgi:N-acetyl-alpha-D-muramate 1-phosphate uridylyltransferase
MKAMLLAAGEGKRLRPLTAHTPKPLLSLGNTSLIGQQLKRLQQAGVEEVIINIAYLGEQIRSALGDGSGYGLSITYSVEPFPLETGGALLQALPLLGDVPFLLLNADVYSDIPLAPLCQHPLKGLGHLVLVPNPEHNPGGDFALAPSGELLPAHKATACYTFAGVSLLHPDLIARYPQKRQVFALREPLQWALQQHQLSGEVHPGQWLDVGTLERLTQAQQLHQAAGV